MAPSTFADFHPPFARWFAACALSAGLVACGGGQTTPAQEKDASAAPTESVSSEAFTTGASLNAAELAAAQRQAKANDANPQALTLDELQPGQIAAQSAFASGAVARKAAATRIPVYRFHNSRTGAHFFTTSTTERDHVIATMSPPYSHEGEAFSVASDFSPGLAPVHRFYNTRTGVHFYTISEAERANVVATLPHFNYEGIAYHASQVAGQGLIPFYRFFVPSKGFHFYTASETEKNSVMANLAATYHFEGVGYYVLDTNWTTGKLPHSGITDQQCYQAGSNTLVPCASSGALALYPQQDGHRTAVNPMSFSAVRATLVSNYPLTSCVRDNVTGLIWEGKTDDGGLRDMHSGFTNQGNGQSDDVSGYVAAVNATNLCGYSDWRMPTRQELQGIMDYGAGQPSINHDGFPNTALYQYWSADVDGADSLTAWYGDFSFGSFHYTTREMAYLVRLVRGSATTAPRFSFSSVSYGSDAANNLVNDAWTGLQWRRCEEGRTWNGSTCTGTASTFTHEQALTYAKAQSGWRFPQVKELASLVDTSRSSGARVDASAFPGAGVTRVWSSTSFAANASFAWDVHFANGSVDSDIRSLAVAVRLVRDPE